MCILYYKTLVDNDYEHASSFALVALLLFVLLIAIFPVPLLDLAIDPMYIIQKSFVQCKNQKYVFADNSFKGIRYINFL